MTVEPHTASVKLMQIQTHKATMKTVESQFRYEGRSAQELLAVARWRRWVRLETQIRCSFCGLQPPGSASWHEPCVIL